MNTKEALEYTNNKMKEMGIPGEFLNPPAYIKEHIDDFLIEVKKHDNSPEMQIFLSTNN
jgi:hypothetical protein